MTEDLAVTKFREYLRVNTEQPKPDYAACRDFLFEYADELKIERQSFETSPGTYFVIMTIPGSDPTASSIMLYSHTDVVPTFREHWTHDPYSAFKDEEGNIFARGAQDMKCVGVQYMEALRRLFQKGVRQFKRTIHIVWGPDEEIGGINGMKSFSKTEAFKNLNIEFALDEGIASEDSIYKVFYAERVPWWIKVTVPGNPGHGSKFIEGTAIEKLHKLIGSVSEFRNEQKELLNSNSEFTIGDVTTANLTIINGGVQVNVVPEKFEAFIDMRVTPKQDFNELKARIDKWAADAGDNVSYEFVQSSNPAETATHAFEEFGGQKLISPHTREDAFWAAVEDSLNEEKCAFKKEIFIGATDSRFIREIGIRAIGFSPIINTPSLLHDHNEFLNEKVFLRGVEIYETLIQNVANV